MNYFLSSDYPDGVFLVGDIHGDISVFLEIGLLAGTFSGSGDIDTIHWTKNKKALLVFLGDIVDSKRPSGGEFEVEMAPNSDQLIIEAIVRLQKEARLEKGRIVFIAGNHELGHITNDISCQGFSHESKCTRKDNYKKEVTAWMLDQLQKLDSVSVCMVDKTLLCHGGVPRNLKPTTVSSINQQYRAFLKRAAKGLVLGADDEVFHQLAWHRPVKFIKQDMQKITHKNKSAVALVVGHTPVVQPSQLGKIDKSDDDDDGVISEAISIEGQIVYLDFAMSSAFSALNPQYCLLGLARLLADNKMQFIYKTHQRCKVQPKK